MPWLKVDDHLWSHPKFAVLSDAAQGLWLRAGSWSMAHLTGGFVGDAVVKAVLNGRPAAVRELVQPTSGYEFGLWERVDGGYRFHDWDEYQPDAEAEKGRRAETSRVRAEAGRKGAQARWGDGKRYGKPVANASEGDGKPMAPNPNPNPNPVSPDGETRTHEAAPPVVDLEARFDEAWAHWPKKQKRKPAFAKFLAAVKRKPVDELVAAIIRFGDAYTAAGTAVNFVPGLDVWLNQERWGEDLPEASGPTSPDAWMQPTARTQRNIEVVRQFQESEGRPMTAFEKNAAGLGQFRSKRDADMYAFMTAADPTSDESPDADFVLGEDGTWGERRP